ncbi:hypothetical protein MZI61_27055, partial [Escherichia coli]|nr:hypothetical protein [Escherichia coli]
WKQHYERRGNRWHPYGTPPSPRHNQHNDHRGDHRPGPDKHHR